MQEVSYSLIFSYGIQMMIVFLVGLLLYTISILVGRSETIVWYKANGLRIALCLILFWLISAGLVIVPNFAGILGALGVNADQSTAAIALAIVGMLIKGKTRAMTEANGGEDEAA